jgi:acetyltransferase-like isoleucine patch superfamily enzyme
MMMLVKLLRDLHGAWNGLLSGIRLAVPRLLGLRTGARVRAGGGIEWPLGNVRNIHIGDGVSLGKRGWFYLPLNNREAQIQIGSGTAVGNDFVISSNGSICIGNDCLISYRVSILDHTHVTGGGTDPTKSGLTPGKAIKIGDGSFIGCGAVIHPGVELGPNCIVEANSVVMRSFPAGSVLSGSPARLLRLMARS